jgi:uncharacterized membrane protein
MNSAVTGVGAAPKSKPSGGLKLAGALAILLLVAVLFVGKFVFHYYLNYTTAFDTYWPRRLGLLAHLTAGTVALLVGPLQLWSGLRACYPRAHRWMGRTYLVAMMIGCTTSFYLAFTTSLGWAFGGGLVSLGIAWATTSAVGYYAILNRNIALHRRWMIRAYVVTFGFVTFRIIVEALAVAGLGNAREQIALAAWLCWAGPLLVTLLVEGVQDVRARRVRATG